MSALDWTQVVIAVLAMLEIGDVRIDLAHRRITRAGSDVRLTPIEYRLLSELVRLVGRVLTHEHLLREV